MTLWAKHQNKIYVKTNKQRRTIFYNPTPYLALSSTPYLLQFPEMLFIIHFKSIFFKKHFFILENYFIINGKTYIPSLPNIYWSDYGLILMCLGNKHPDPTYKSKTLIRETMFLYWNTNFCRENFYSADVFDDSLTRYPNQVILDIWKENPDKIFSKLAEPEREVRLPHLNWKRF